MVPEEYISTHKESLYYKAETALQQYREKIQEFLKKLASFPQNSQNKLLTGTLHYIDTILEITQTGLPFEGEKM